MIISIASGKGGTGKTTIATNLALSIDVPVQFLDCDAEEPDAHIFLKPTIKETEKVFISIPEINEARCTYCGKCAQVCAYNAIAVLPPSNGMKGNVLVFPHLCHGCGSCSFFCPQKAIKEVGKEIGEVEIGNVGLIQFLQGRLNVGEAMASPVIRQIKKYINPTRIVIIDAPPGTSCPVIEAVKGSDFCVLVTEPTPFGLNDLILMVEAVKKLIIPFGVIINRADVGDDKVELYCNENKIPILMRIPFDRKIAELYSMGIILIEEKKEYKEKFKEVFNFINRLYTKKGKKNNENRNSYLFK
jgi:MinD superfamily P-loop ATPase